MDKKYIINNMDNIIKWFLIIIILTVDFYPYKYEYLYKVEECNNKLVVCLDPGHGGVGIDGRYTTRYGKMFVHSRNDVAIEGVVNRLLVKSIAKTLKQFGVLVVYSVHPDDPTDLSMYKRCVRINKYHTMYPNMVLISVHNNASKAHKGYGYCHFTSRGVTTADTLSYYIANEISDYKTSNKLRWCGVGNYKRDEEAGFYMLKNTACPAILVECAFFDNIKDWKLMQTNMWKSSMSIGISAGIIKFFNRNNKIEITHSNGKYK